MESIQTHTSLSSLLTTQTEQTHNGTKGERRSKAHKVEVKKLGEGRDNLESYSLKTEQILAQASNPEQEIVGLLDMDEHGKPSRNSRFAKMSRRFFPDGLYREDLELVAATEFWQSRTDGRSIKESFQRAKSRAFDVALKHYNLLRKYEAKLNCECDQCYVGRPSKCLNGTPIIVEKLETLPLDCELANGKIVEDLIADESGDGERYWTGIMKRIGLVYRACRDEKDRLIIDGKRQGKTLKEIGSKLEISRSAVHQRLTKIADRFQSYYNR